MGLLNYVLGREIALPPLSQEVIEEFAKDLDNLHLPFSKHNGSLLVDYSSTSAGTVDSYTRLLKSARKRILRMQLACGEIVEKGLFDEYCANFVEELDGLKRSTLVVLRESWRVHGLIFDKFGKNLLPKSVLKDRLECYKHAASFFPDADEEVA